MTTTLASLGPLSASSGRIRKIGAKIKKNKSKVLKATQEYTIVEYSDGINKEIVRIKEDGSYTRITDSINKLREEAEALDDKELSAKFKKANMTLGIT